MPLLKTFSRAVFPLIYIFRIFTINHLHSIKDPIVDSEYFPCESVSQDRSVCTVYTVYCTHTTTPPLSLPCFFQREFICFSQYSGCPTTGMAVNCIKNTFFTAMQPFASCPFKRSMFSQIADSPLLPMHQPDFSEKASFQDRAPFLDRRTAKFNLAHPS